MPKLSMSGHNVCKYKNKVTNPIKRVTPSINYKEKCANNINPTYIVG